MASIIQPIGCPHCSCSATEDFYYKMGEEFIWCFRCGYYEKNQAYYDSGKNEVYFIENEYYSNRKRRRRIGANFFS